MAENRVLNYSEFAGKYQKNAEQDIAASYSEFSKASDNFQEGFDEDTYEDGQAGPKRPIASGEEATPAAPDSMPTPTQGMEAPAEEHEEEIEHEEYEEEVEDEEPSEEEYEEDEEFEGGDPEAGEEEEEDEDEEGEEDEDEEEEANESVNVRRNRFILESFDEFEARGPIPSQPHRHSEYDDIASTIELDFEDNYNDEEEDDDDCFVVCKSCGSKKSIEPGTYPMGAKNEADPDSWWQGAAMGMQCGCNM